MRSSSAVRAASTSLALPQYVLRDVARSNRVTFAQLRRRDAARQDLQLHLKCRDLRG